VSGWREGAIHLEIHDRRAVVRVERGGRWIDVINDYYGYHVSHIVEVGGINAALASPPAPQPEGEGSSNG